MNALENTIKVIFVITGSDVGGAEKMLYHTIKGLNPQRYVVKLCSLKKKGVFARRLESDGVEVHSLNMRDDATLAGWFDSLRALMLLMRYLCKERPAIIHSFLFRANIIARIAGYYTGVPVIISSVRVMGGEKKYHHFIERITAFMTDHFVAVSNQVKEHIVHKVHIDEGKVSTIYNGVAVENSDTFDISALMSDIGLKTGERIVMTAGRLHRQKGYDYLIQAMPMVQAAFSEVKLLILGEGEEEKYLKKLADSLELTKKIVFMGVRSDVDRMMLCSEIFVLPSRWEGMPNVLLEAMAAGIPVVATAVGGVPELVDQGITGVLVPPQDILALAEAIKYLLSDTKRAHAMGEAGRHRVQERFSMGGMIAKTEALYQELLARKKSS